MKRKIFLSINIPERDKRRLFKLTKKWPDLPVRWTREANLHLTLAFLGYVDEEIIPEICKLSGEAAENSEVFDIRFNRVELFPSASEPRMIALIGEPNDDLKNLVNNLEKKLGLSSAQKKTFRPHITLGRIRKNKWESQENKPGILEKFSLIVDVSSIEIMASDFQEGDYEYAVIESCPLS